VEPQIQYATTSDGVSIAYWGIGRGDPTAVFVTSPPFSHIQLEWQWPEVRRFYERLAEDRTMVRYDGRGSGLSERDVSHFSLESQILDLEAVVDALGARRVALLGYVDGGPAAVAYAARHPERVSHLLLWCTYARGGFMDETQVQGLFALLDKDWRLFTETLVYTMSGFSGGEIALRWADFLQHSTSPEMVRLVWEASFSVDITGLLPEVRTPTLILHPSQVRWANPDEARALASRMPNARIAFLEGVSGVQWWDESGGLTQIQEFLGEGEPSARQAEPAAPGTFRTILFTDVEGSTALTQRLGDTEAREVLREHERIVREALRTHGGAEVKTMGDGFMASFPSATKALECAVAMQRAFEERNGGVGAHGRAPLQVRIGLNAGEPIAEDDPEGRGDLFGTAVNLAARIAALAKGGEVLVSDVVRQLVAGKGFLFADRGDVALRGFEDPVRLYEVRWRPFDSPSADATGGSG